MKKEKNYIAIITSNNVRMKRVEDISLYKNSKNVIINPDLSKVVGLSPDKWKWNGNEFVPKSLIEVAYTQQHQKHFGVDNNEEIEVNKKISWYFYLLGVVGIGLIIYKFL